MFVFCLELMYLNTGMAGSNGKFKSLKTASLFSGDFQFIRKDRVRLGKGLRVYRCLIYNHTAMFLVIDLKDNKTCFIVLF